MSSDSEDDGLQAGAAGTSTELALDTQVTVAGYLGNVRFLGETKFAQGLWVGVELEQALGANDGSVQDERYFTCEPKYGIFVRREVVKDAAERGKGSVTDLTSAEVVDSTQQEDSPRQLVHRRPGARRRLAVSAEDTGKFQEKVEWTAPVHKKSAEERRQLREIIRTSNDTKLQIMFGDIPESTFEQVIDAMFIQKFEKGCDVIKEGEEGDYFYIVKYGNFDIMKKRVRDGVTESPKVFEASVGFAFGELALLYNANRSATITAVVDSEVWSLERNSFRNLVVASSELRFTGYMNFLKKCEIFQELNDEQIAALAEVLEEEAFENDEAILEQGEKDDKMYILQSGNAAACIRGEEGDVEVMAYKQGDFFGEIALLLGEPRKASVYAVGDVVCLYITRGTFLRVLGPLQDFLQTNIDKYQKYTDAIQAASAQGYPDMTKASTCQDVDAPDEMEVWESDAFQGRQIKNKLVNRKRDRASARAHLPAGAAEDRTEMHEAEPASLKEKIAQDFTNSALVTPDAAFAIAPAGLAFQGYGGLRLGEHFTDDKVVLAHAKVSPTTDGVEDSYTWQGPSSLQGTTEIAILCQKGRKSASDPTPNQDNFFVLHLGPYGIYGVCDGHGPFGHLVSFRLVQSLPSLITSSTHFGKDWKACLIAAFMDAQKDLLTFCSSHDINVEASGAAGSVLVFDGDAVHVAHIGDASTMVASWNRHNSRVVHGTKDHKPQNAEEMARLEAAGTEVRKVDEESYRIYRQGTTFPGLTMSRAFGDTACAGVIQEPEYQQLFMQQADEWYAIVASDGVWEFMDFETVLKLSAKKLRLKGTRETARFLVEASRKRWEHCCGEYCDDITVVLIQWNLQNKETKSTNHTVNVTRHA